MGSLRTPEMDAKYEAYKAQGGLAGKCDLCEAPALQTFTYWKIINNNFPYDKAAEVHHMVLPVVHVSQEEIPIEAWHELDDPKKGIINTMYDFIIEPTLKKRSIPAHFHLHLIIAEDN